MLEGVVKPIIERRSRFITTVSDTQYYIVIPHITVNKRSPTKF